MVCQCRNAFKRQSSKNAGSFFLSDIARTTSSSSPGGKLSDSISVTKPCRYFWLMSASTSCDLLDTIEFRFRFRARSRRVASNFPGQSRDAHRGRIEPGQLAQRHILQSAANRSIDPLPRAADSTLALDAALARGAAAFGNGDGAFERIENLRCRDLLRISCKTISAQRAAR